MKVTSLSLSPTFAPGSPFASILFSRKVISTSVAPGLTDFTLNFSTVFISIFWSIIWPATSMVWSIVTVDLLKKTSPSFSFHLSVKVSPGAAASSRVRVVAANMAESSGLCGGGGCGQQESC